MPEKIRQCKEYIEELLGQTIPASALEESSGDMHNLCFNNVEEFADVLQALGIKELYRNQNIYFMLNVPNSGSWNVILSKYQSKQFEDTYKSYKIKRQHVEKSEIKNKGIYASQ